MNAGKAKRLRRLAREATPGKAWAWYVEHGGVAVNAEGQPVNRVTRVLHEGCGRAYYQWLKGRPRWK